MRIKELFEGVEKEKVRHFHGMFVDGYGWVTSGPQTTKVKFSKNVEDAHLILFGNRTFLFKLMMQYVQMHISGEKVQYPGKTQTAAALANKKIHIFHVLETKKTVKNGAKTEIETAYEKAEEIPKAKLEADDYSWAEKYKSKN